MRRIEAKRFLQFVIGKMPALLVVVVAAGAFWFLTAGGVVSPVDLQGYAEAIDVGVGPLHTGRVLEIHVRPGDKVRPGDTVAVMDRRELVARREVVQAELAEARARVEAETDLQEAEVARSELAALKTVALVRQSQAELESLKQQNARLEKLAAEKLVRVEDLEDGRYRQSGLAARVQTLGDAQARGRAGLASTSASEASRRERVAIRVGPFREAVQRKEAELRETDVALEETVLRANVDGVVSTVLASLGEVVSSGRPVVTVVTARAGRVVVWIPERHATKVAVDRSATLLRGGRLLGSNILGRVVEVSPEVVELPVRARSSTSPGVPVWGRRVVVEVQGKESFLPGEAFSVRL
ncbi:MAG: HlyD family efflux transporter periplasmic adaptor subunit [Pseudomonadota bacterium]